MSNQMTYPSLKCVLQYMDPNLRINLYQRLPAIRTAEKATPLHINELYIEPLLLKINETSYRFGMIRDCDDPELLESYKKRNRNGGEQIDLDAYGLQDSSFEMTPLPGDVVLEKPIPIEMNRLVDLEPRLRQLMIQEGFEQNDVPAAPQEAEEPGDARFEDVIAPQPERVEELYRQQQLNRKLNLDVIKEYQESILPHRLKADNAVSPFTNFIKLTVKIGKKLQREENLVYNKSVFKAMKHFMETVLGGRKRLGTIHVKKFRAFSGGGVLRVPGGLQLRIQHLEVGRDVGKVMKALNPIIHEASFPLKYCEFNSTMPLVEDFHHPVVRQAGKLIIIDTFGFHAWLPSFLEIQNREVIWRRAGFSLVDTVAFINNWLEQGRPLGTKFVFSVAREEFAGEIIPLLKEIPNARLAELEGAGCDLFPIVFSFPMGDTLELNIFGTPCEVVYKDTLWDFTMKVMPRGSAKCTDLK